MEVIAFCSLFGIILISISAARWGCKLSLNRPSLAYSTFTIVQIPWPVLLALSIMYVERKEACKAALDEVSMLE